MLIFNKKKIGIILFIVLFLILLFTIAIQKLIKTTVVSTTPIKTIVLDAGHGFPDERCI